MTTTIEAIKFTHELVSHVGERQDKGISGKDISKDIQTILRIISMQAEHLQNKSKALVKLAENLKSRVENQDLG